MWKKRGVVSESLNSGALPAFGIDCRVQRRALAVRYHYSSIDRTALKSKSHLVAQDVVSGSGDHGKYVCLFVRCETWCVCMVCVYVKAPMKTKCVSRPVCFTRLLFTPFSSLCKVSFSLLLPVPLCLPLSLFFSLTLRTKRWLDACCILRSLDPPLLFLHMNRL